MVCQECPELYKNLLMAALNDRVFMQADLEGSRRPTTWGGMHPVSFFYTTGLQECPELSDIISLACFESSQKDVENQPGIR